MIHPKTHSDSPFIHSLPRCHWQEVAATVLTVVLVTLALLAFCKVGHFAQCGYSWPIGSAAALLAFLVPIAAIARRYYSHSTHQPPGNEIETSGSTSTGAPKDDAADQPASKESDTPKEKLTLSPEDVVPPPAKENEETGAEKEGSESPSIKKRPLQPLPIDLPAIPLGLRLPHSGVKESSLDWNDERYALNRTAEEKLRVQSDWAVRDGLKNKTVAGIKVKEFSVNLLRNLLDEVKKMTDGTLEFISSTPRPQKFSTNPNILVQINATRYPERVGVAETVGYNSKKGMEDLYGVAEISLPDGRSAFFVAVYDGHGDHRSAADILEKAMPPFLTQKLAEVKELDDTAITDILIQSFIQIEQSEDFSRLRREEKGTTAVCSLIMDDKFYVANVGDSRAVLMREHNSISRSEDADPEDERFKKTNDKLIYSEEEIEKLLPEQQEEARNRNGELLERRPMVRVARDIGIDFLSTRAKITKTIHGMDDPEQGIYGYQIGDYGISASDGLWDVCSNDELHTAMAMLHNEGKTLQEMAAYLVEAALAAGSNDNITVIVYRL